MKSKKKRSKSKAQPERKAAEEGITIGEVFSYVKSFAVALFLALMLKHFVIEAYRIPTGSMEDTILIGDFLLANKFIYGIRIPFTDVRIPFLRDPEQGDVVIFKFPLDPSLNYVKRCIAGPGQVVEVRDKEVYVDGVLYDDDAFTKYDPPSVSSPGAHNDLKHYFGPFEVPPDHFFMMGDNRDNSSDSRFWGAVPRKNVLGKALFLHWSWGSDPKAPRINWSDPADIIYGIAYNFLHFYDRVRWERLGMPVI